MSNEAKKIYLSPGDLDEHFGGGVLHSDFSQDSVAVVGHDDPAHGVHQHLEHGLGAEAGPDQVANSLRKHQNRYTQY